MADREYLIGSEFRCDCGREYRVEELASGRRRRRPSVSSSSPLFHLTEIAPPFPVEDESGPPEDAA